MVTKERGTTDDVVRAMCMIVFSDITFNYFFLNASDCHPDASLHSRGTLHNGEHLGPCKYQMVPW
jgi:hypothetical protein